MLKKNNSRNSVDIDKIYIPCPLSLRGTCKHFSLHRVFSFHRSVEDFHHPRIRFPDSKIVSKLVLKFLVKFASKFRDLNRVI